MLGWYRRAKATKRGGMGGEESECLIVPPKRGNGGKGAPAGGTVGGKDGQHPEGGSRLHVTTTDSRTEDPVPTRPRGGKGAPAGGTVGGKDGQHTEVGSRLHVTTTDSRTGQTSLRDGGGHRLASWTSGYATARSEAVCRGAGCGRTRTSGSVGGQGQQRPWSTRPRAAVTVARIPRVREGERRSACGLAPVAVGWCHWACEECVVKRDWNPGRFGHSLDH